MPGKKESVFINDQSLNVDETVRSSVLKTIKDSKNLQEAIEQLEKEKLIWYLIGPLRKDEEVRKQINSKWEANFQRFEQSVNAAHKELKLSLPNQSFLVYSTKDNDFNIKFESKEEPVKISDILRASSEGKVYHISLGEDNQITASKKNGNERHCNFTGSGSCEMTISWQAKDSKGNSISCSMTVEVGSNGIQRMTSDPKFGDLKFTSSLSEEEEGKMLELVEQNKEVFINGKTLYQAFTNAMDKNVGNHPTLKEKTFIRNPPASPQLPTPDSSGYFSTSTPSSRRGSFSSVSGFGGEEEHRQEEDELESKVKELEKENEDFRKKNAELKKLNQEIAEENYIIKEELIKKKQARKEEVKEFRTKLERMIKELDSKNQKIEQLSQKVGELEQESKDKDSKIADLESQLKDRESEVQSTNKINEELREKLKQIEVEFRALQEENTKLGSNIEKIVKDLEDNYKKQLAEKEKKLANAGNLLSEWQLQIKELAEELNKIRKEKENLEEVIRQPSGESLAAEIEEVNEKKDEKVKNLEEEIKRKDEKIQQIMKEKEELKEEFQEKIDSIKQLLGERENVLTGTQEELKSVKESLEQLQDILQQKEGQGETAAISTQTEVRHESKGIQASIQQHHIKTEPTAPKTQD